MNDAPSPSLLSWFEHLRAEDEPWLEQVYQPPSIFDQAAARRSTVVVGGRGSGKTALLQAIAHQVAQTEPGALLVEWFPEPPDEEMDESRLAVFVKRQAMSAAAEALLRKLGSDPALLQGATGWAQDGLAWFLRAYLPTDPHYLLLMIASNLNPQALPGVQALLDRPERTVVRDAASYDTVMKVLLGALNALHIPSVWFLVDGLEKWSQGLEQRLTSMLAILLDTLNFFEKPGVVFKLFVPAHLRQAYLGSAGVERKRLEPLDLKWDPDRLDQLVVQRGAAAGVEIASLRQLSSDPAFFDWLAAQAGDSPREWLRLSYPFLRPFGARPSARPLDEKEWREIAWRNPPRLRIDLDTRRLFLGEGEVQLSAANFALLEYLYRNQGRYCTREEIYYRVMRGLEHVPAEKDPAYEYTTSWNGRFDTALWRLREQIEPRPDAPVYVVTYRRRGVRLENAW